MKSHLNSTILQKWSNETKHISFETKGMKFEQQAFGPQHIVRFLEIQEH